VERPGDRTLCVVWGTGNGSDLDLADVTATMMKTMNQPNSFQRLLGGPGAEGLHRRM
jgi:tripartite-type tricarboxylate transporter receptor subunit TctC